MKTETRRRSLRPSEAYESAKTLAGACPRCTTGAVDLYDRIAKCANCGWEDYNGIYRAAGDQPFFSVPEAGTAHYRGGRVRFEMDHALKFLGDDLLSAVATCPYCGHDARCIKPLKLMGYVKADLTIYKYRCTGAEEHSVILWLANGVHAWR